MNKTIRKILAAAAAVIVTAAAMTACTDKEGTPVRETSGENFISPDDSGEFLNTILITVSEPFTDEELSALLEKYGLSLVYDLGHAKIYAFKCEGARDQQALNEVMQQMRKEPKIRTVEQDRKVQLTDPVQERRFTGGSESSRPGKGPLFRGRWRRG